MIPFLHSVAIELVARHGSAVADFLIVLPHKRGVTYMRRYFERVLTDRLLRIPKRSEMPQILTIAEHIEEISGLKRASNLQLLFALYATWRELFAHGQPPTAQEFEEFRRWGEIAISDFNDVDMYGVDAEALFKNLSDYNEIRTDFLTDEQKEVIEKYFGVSNPGFYVNRFWHHFRPESDLQKRFLSLWEKLSPLYKKYVEQLLHKQLAYPGLSFRVASEKVESGTYKFRCSKVVYVGFNALSTVERRMFKSVRDIPSSCGGSMADFFWDAPGPALAKSSPVEAARFLYRNAEEFPCSVADMSKYAVPDSFPQVMQEIACPGNTAQAKVVTGLLEKIIQGHGQPYINPARVAVVLPDEGLLFPIFHSVPEDVAQNVNLTMGYPLRLTSVASFVSLLRQLHTRARKSGGEYKLYHKDVVALLSHPLTRTLLGQQCANLIHGFIIDSHLYFVSPADIERAIPADVSICTEAMSLLFSPLPQTDEPTELIAYFCDILRLLRTVVAPTLPCINGEESASPTSLETVHIDRYLEAFEEFAAQCNEYGLRMPARTALVMACRLLASDTVSMQGEPLTGLQIMGMLETRALDFDYLIIPSMNERVFPRRLRPRTFIPEALRIGYGIATTRFQEEIFSYHFYRLIARAKEVYLLYDASQGGLKSGDPSRYLLQLRYLFANKCNLQRKSARFHIAPAVTNRVVEVEKSGEVAEILKEYLSAKGERRLSASSIKDYIACPLKFYFSYILKKKVEEAPTEFMGAAVIGNVLHETMEHIYNTLSPTPQKPAVVTAACISGWLAGEQVGEYRNIRELAVSRIRNNYMPSAPDEAPLPGDAQIMLDMLEQQVRWCLEADMRQAPFEYLSSEWKLPAVYTMADGRRVNMTMIIDRLDRINLANGQKRLRIVDYKTGKDNTSFKNVAELFAPDGEHKAIFQLMLYAQLLVDEKPDLASDGAVALSIYKSRQLHRNNFEAMVTQGDKPVYSHLPLLAEFRSQLDDMLAELFNTELPFAPREGMPDDSEFSNKPCKYCPFSRLCMS